MRSSTGCGKARRTVKVVAKRCAIARLRLKSSSLRLHRYHRPDAPPPPKPPPPPPQLPPPPPVQPPPPQPPPGNPPEYHRGPRGPRVPPKPPMRLRMSARTPTTTAAASEPR